MLTRPLMPQLKAMVRRNSLRHAGDVGGAENGVQIRDLAREAAQDVEQRHDHQRHAPLAGRRPVVSPVASPGFELRFVVRWVRF